jgi:hypothetical protein
MKIRSSFVTNSSSSSYIVVYSVNDSSELRDFIKEEFGNHGMKSFESSLGDGSKIKAQIEYLSGECNENIDALIKDDVTYLYGEKISYSSYGDGSDPIFDMIQSFPVGTCEYIWEGESN